MMNLFGSTEDMKYINIYTGWATAHFQFVLGYDTANCIVTQARRGAQQGATIQPAALRHSRPALGTGDSASARPGRWGGSQ